MLYSTVHDSFSCDDVMCFIRRPHIPKEMPLSDVFVVTHKNSLKTEEDRLRKANPLPCDTPGPLGWCWRVPAALVKKDSSCLKLQTGTSPAAIWSHTNGSQPKREATAQSQGVFHSLSPIPHQKPDFWNVLQDLLSLIISLRDAALAAFKTSKVTLEKTGRNNRA